MINDRGLINTFRVHWVKERPVSKELGRQLKRAEEMRLVADDNGESVMQADASELVNQADVFVRTMQDLFFAALALLYWMSKSVSKSDVPKGPDA